MPCCADRSEMCLSCCAAPEQHDYCVVPTIHYGPMRWYQLIRSDVCVACIGVVASVSYYYGMRLCDYAYPASTERPERSIDGASVWSERSGAVAITTARAVRCKPPAVLPPPGVGERRAGRPPQAQRQRAGARARTWRAVVRHVVRGGAPEVRVWARGPRAGPRGKFSLRNKYRSRSSGKVGNDGPSERNVERADVQRSRKWRDGSCWMLGSTCGQGQT